MHTTHSARYGSRAGLGVTFIQWGFGLRARLDDVNGPGLESPDAWPSFGSEQEANEWFNANLDQLNATTLASTNVTTSWSNSGEGGTEGPTGFLTSTAASEWLSFLLMTVGWFLLFTSAFGFWRVKRWERGILSSTTTPAPTSARDEETRRQSLFERLGVFRPPSSRGASRADAHEAVPTPAVDEVFLRHFEMELQLHTSSDPDHVERIREALVREQRLYEDLRAAGML